MEILTEVRRPDDDGVDRTLFTPRRPVAWKTGTSFGKRDAWAVGATPDWVVGVWVGNFSGQGNSSLGGARAAAPILFAAFDLLPGHREGRWYRAPTDVRSIRLCSDSGFRAGEDCPQTHIAQRPRRSPPVAVCPYHRSFWIDPETGFEVCSRCWKTGDHQRITRLILPADAAQLMRRAGHRIDSSPIHNPDCPVSSPHRPLRVLYPAAGATLLVPRDLDDRPERITLRASHTSAAAALHWYVDGNYHGRTTGDHAVSLFLESGPHRGRDHRPGRPRGEHDLHRRTAKLKLKYRAHRECTAKTQSSPRPSQSTLHQSLIAPSHGNLRSIAPSHQRVNAI